jgi:hypothetical protein
MAESVNSTGKGETEFDYPSFRFLTNATPRFVQKR